MNQNNQNERTSNLYLNTMKNYHKQNQGCSKEKTVGISQNEQDHQGNGLLLLQKQGSTPPHPPVVGPNMRPIVFSNRPLANLKYMKKRKVD